MCAGFSHEALVAISFENLYEFKVFDKIKPRLEYVYYQSIPKICFTLSLLVYKQYAVEMAKPIPPARKHLFSPAEKENENSYMYSIRSI